MDLQGAPDDRTAEEWLELGRAKLREGSPQEAVDLLTEALAVDPDLAAARLALGIAYGRLGDLGMALAALERAAGAYPPPRHAHYYLALAQRESGDVGAATRSLLEALRLDPDHAPTRQALKELSSGSLPAPPVPVAEGVLALCPQCGSPALKEARTAICSLCGLDLTTLYRGWVLATRDLTGEEHLVCRACRKRVRDLWGECPKCGLSFLTGHPRVDVEPAPEAPDHLVHGEVPEGGSLDWTSEGLASPLSRMAAYPMDLPGLVLCSSLFGALLGPVPGPLTAHHQDTKTPGRQGRGRRGSTRRHKDTKGTKKTCKQGIFRSLGS